MTFERGYVTIKEDAVGKEAGMKARDLTRTALFVAVLAVCSYLSFPLLAVSFSMQTFGVFLAVLLLGGKRASLTVLLYLLLGLCGAPVFAGFRGGISVFLGPSGGYLIGFLGLTTIAWLFGRRRCARPVSLLCGMLVCYACAVGWFWLVYTPGGMAGMWEALCFCVFPFLLPDAIKLLAALGLARALETRSRIFRNI